MKPNRPLWPWIVAGSVTLLLIYAVSAYGELLDCVNRRLHSDHPDAVSVVWEECRALHLYFPFSYFG